MPSVFLMFVSLKVIRKVHVVLAIHISDCVKKSYGVVGVFLVSLLPAISDVLAWNVKSNINSHTALFFFK